MSTSTASTSTVGTATAPATADAISTNLIEFIARQTRKTVTADVDLFGSGLVSSLFAMQLVAYVESTFGVAVAGPDLKLANFRSVVAITELVRRLRGDDEAAAGTPAGGAPADRAPAGGENGG